MTATGLRLRDVAVRRAGSLILRDVALDVDAGSLVSIVGPSGAGKTTLLRAIAGLEPLTDGQVLVDGLDLADTPVHRRGMAAVFQQPRLFANLDVAGNVAFPLRARGMGRGERRQRAIRLLDEVGLAGFAERDVGGLSGGEARRTALARALAGSPRILLLDEPFVGVEPARRAGLRQLVRRLHEQHGMTTLYVTHDRAEAAEMGDTVALVIEGRIWQHAPPRDLFERPSSPVVARFFGADNVLSGEVRAGRLTVDGGTIPVPGGDGPATIAIRPERLRLAADGSLHGRVASVTYRGDHLRVEVDVGRPLLLDVAATVQVATGQLVQVAVDAEAVWRLPDQAGAADVAG